MFHKRLRKRCRNNTSFSEVNHQGIFSAKNIITQAFLFVLNDITKENSKIKKLFSKLKTGIVIDDKKEIKNAKYKVLEGGKHK